MPNFGLQGLVNKWVNVNQSNVVLKEEDDISVRLRAPRASASSLKPKAYPRKPSQRRSSTTKKAAGLATAEDDAATVCTASTYGTARSAFPAVGSVAVAPPRGLQFPAPGVPPSSRPLAEAASGTIPRPGYFRHSSSADIYSSDDTSSVAANSAASSKRRKTKRMQMSAAAPLMPPGVYYGVDYDSVSVTGRDATSVRSAPAKVEGPPPPTSLFHPLCPTVPAVVGMPPPPPMAALPEVADGAARPAKAPAAVALDHRDWSNEPAGVTARDRAKEMSISSPPPPGVFNSAEPGPPLVVSVPLGSPSAPAHARPQAAAPTEAPVQMMHFDHAPMPSDAGSSSDDDSKDNKVDDGGMASIEAQMEAALVLTSLPKVGVERKNAEEEKKTDSTYPASSAMVDNDVVDDERASRRLLKGGKRGTSPWRRKAKNLAEAALQEYRCLEQKEAQGQKTEGGDKVRLKRTNSKVTAMIN